ncbi:MAG: ThiF family adenylyltransferase [archaeon]
MRYSRQEAVIGKRAQQVIEQSTVAIVGIGALGSVMAEILCRVGIKKLILIDRDIVELSNLQRQSLYTEADVGKPKVSAAATHLRQIRQDVQLELHAVELFADNVHILKKAQLIMDGTDNFPTRFLLNDYCLKTKKPFIHAAVIEGRGFVFPVLKKPCLRCLLGETSVQDSCDAQGVLGSIVHVIAGMACEQACRTLIEKSCEPFVTHVDLIRQQYDRIRVLPRKNCPACNKKFMQRTALPSTFCGGTTFQFRTTQAYPALKKKYASEKTFREFTIAFSCANCAFFPDGRVIVQAPNEKSAKAIFSKL